MWDVSLKLMAPIVQAFDLPTFASKDLALFPESVLHHLEAGGFEITLETFTVGVSDAAPSYFQSGKVPQLA